MKQFEIETARRLVLSDKNGKSSPAVKVAKISVALSIAVMLIAVGVVFGFKKEITRKVMGMNPQITLYPGSINAEGRSTVRLDGTLADRLDSLPYIADWSPTINTLALLKTSDNFKGLYIKGLGPSTDISFLHENLVKGGLPDFENMKDTEASLLISQKTADDMRLAVGDSISVYSFSTEIKLKRMKVAGIYDTHLDMFDNSLAFTSIPTAAYLGSYSPGEVSAINITVEDPRRIDLISDELQEEFGNEGGGLSLKVTNIYEQCRGIFGWLGMLDTNVWVILVLLTLVSAFTLISGMLIIILEKVRFIGVMKALGASSKSIRRVFIWLAMRIGLTGMIWGTSIGLIVLAIQYFLTPVRLNPDAYYMNYAPVDFPWIAFLAIEAGFAVIIYFVLVIPSRLVSRISPSESMRFE